LTNGQTTFIGDVDYKVIEPPKPTVEMLVNNRKYNGASPVPKASRILLQVEADKEFKESLPNDAKYGVTNVKILAQLSLGPPTTVGNASGGRADRAVFVSRCQPLSVRLAPVQKYMFVLMVFTVRTIKDSESMITALRK
jgi:hypothetical protein